MSGTHTATNIPSTQSDPLAEIQKYKALLDSGAIIEEYAARKRQITNI